MKRICTVIFSVFLLLMSFASCAKSTEPGALAKGLFEKRVTDISEVSAVQTLVDTLMQESEYGAFTIDVANSRSSYTLKISFQELMGRSEALTTHLYRVGSALMALIDGCDSVEMIYRFNNDDGVKTTTTQTVSPIRAEKLLGASAVGYVQSAADVQTMLDKLELS